MTHASLKILALAAALAAALPAPAYQVETHRAMSINAAGRSKLATQALPLGRDLRVIDIDSPLSDGGVYFYFFTAFENRKAVKEWVGEGAVLEDDKYLPTPTRWTRHFYNPIAPANRRGLFNGTFVSSFDWGLEPTDDAFQQWSLKDARGYFYKSLTGATVRERKQNLSWLYRALGHTIHLVQDLAQPQHTRDESHGLFHYYESYTSQQLARGLLPFGGYANVPIVRPEEAWTAAGGRGMADFSNREFVTDGTNFGGNLSGGVSTITTHASFPSPRPTGYEVVPATNLNTPGLVGNMYFISTQVTDPVRNEVSTNPRASTWSLYSADLERRGASMSFALNRFNYDVAHQYLIPRAVGYSAGLLDHFFRGTLEVSATPDGVYSIIDFTGTTTAFEKIKLKVKNTTAEGLGGGTLWAVAKYNRNSCWRADLTGEYNGPNAPNIIACRSRDADGEISVSAPIEAFSLGSGAEREVTFTFVGNPIPAAATDLYLQVVYRGPIGTADPTQDAMALGFKDLYEPTFMAFFNATDMTELDNKYYSFQQVVAGVEAGDPTFAKVDLNGNKQLDAGDFLPIPQAFLNVSISFVGIGQRPVARIASLQPGRFSRLAVLTDRNPVAFFPGSFGFSHFPAVNQLNETGTTFFVRGVLKLRDVWVTNGSVIRYCVPNTTCEGDLTTMPKAENVPDALVPVPVEITIQYP